VTLIIILVKLGTVKKEKKPRGMISPKENKLLKG
jgi:hypothetical protein